MFNNPIRFFYTDNIPLNEGSGGKTVATLDVAGVQHEKVIVEQLVAGVPEMIDSGNPLFVTDAAAAALLTSIAGEDFATQATLAALNSKVTAVNTGAVVVSSSALPTGAATAANQQTNALTDVQLRATPVPISGTVAVTGAGDATAANQTTQITAEQAIQTAVQIMDDWDESDRAKVNLIVGQAGIAAGTGVDGATVPRVTLATNVGLPAGSQIIGKTGIDQTTPGTTNLVALTAETTKVIGTVNVSAAQTIANVTTLGTITNTVPVQETRVSTATLSNVASSASNVTLLASNANRRQAMFYNDSTAILYLKFGATATSSSFTVLMVAGAYYELPQPVYTGIIDGLWNSANGACRVTELT